jgi:hypothetical protein
MATIHGSRGALHHHADLQAQSTTEETVSNRNGHPILIHPRTRRHNKHEPRTIFARPGENPRCSTLLTCANNAQPMCRRGDLNDHNGPFRGRRRAEPSSRKRQLSCGNIWRGSGPCRWFPFCSSSGCLRSACTATPRFRSVPRRYEPSWRIRHSGGSTSGRRATSRGGPARGDRRRRTRRPTRAERQGHRGTPATSTRGHRQNAPIWR